MSLTVKFFINYSKTNGYK